jgi:hypothetical protein
MTGRPARLQVTDFPPHGRALKSCADQARRREVLPLRHIEVVQNSTLLDTFTVSRKR